MQLTLSSKEFNEAVALWLAAQGFTPDIYDISTRVIAGRSDGPLGTRIEAQIEPKVSHVIPEVIPTHTPVETVEVTQIRMVAEHKFGQRRADD